MNQIQQLILDAWTSNGKTKPSPAGFIAGNAVCCIHNGETVDTRKRAGIKLTGESVGYNCFNCGFKTRWEPGMTISKNMKNLMGWMGIDNADIKRLSIVILQHKTPSIKTFKKQNIKFENIELPKGSRHIKESDTEMIEYINDRGLELNSYPFYMSDDISMRRRIITPFYWEHNIVGFSARLITNMNNKKIPKYISKNSHGYVFNMHNQYNKKIVLVTEGTFDAISIGGISTLGNTVNNIQASIINGLNRKVVIVPDADSSGKLLIEAALERGWSVSFPQWLETCKDSNESVKKYGRIFTIQNILDNIIENPIKIKILAKI